LALTIDLEAPALEFEENLTNVRQGILGRLNLDSWRSSSKIEALVEELSNLRLQDATTKSLVFSQFVNFLDLIAYRLQKAGFNVCYSFYELPDIPKANSTDARFAVWKERCHPKLEMPPSNTSVRFTPFICSVFNADSTSLVNNINVTVFLVSLKAGGVALNLTEASRVYLMDSWWNPAVSSLLAFHASFFDKRSQLQVEYRMLCFIEG
jgi:DNA repair protein RAD16